jgi:soluble lytic murein transglycosylase-like protein
MFSDTMKRFILFSVLSCFVLVAGSAQSDYDRNAHSVACPGDNYFSEDPISVDYAAGHISYHKLIYSTALKYQVEPLLVRAIIQVESSGRSMSVSGKGAMGDECKKSF